MQAAKDKITQLLVLAVDKSMLKDQLPGSELRPIVDAVYPSLTDGGRLRLQIIWDLYAAKEGFDAKVAAAPMCWIKSLEARLPLAVDLPDSLVNLRNSEIATNAAKCFIKPAEVDRVLGLDAPRATPGPQPGVRTSGQARVPSLNEPGLGRTGSGSVPALDVRLGDTPAAAAALDIDDLGAPPVNLDTLGAQPAPSRTTLTQQPAVFQAGMSSKQKKLLVFSLVTLVAAGLVLYLTLRDEAIAPQKADVSVLEGVPVTEALRMGTTSRYVIDPAWLEQPEATRTEVLRNAAARLQSQGIETVLLVDARGKPLGSAAWIGPDLRVRWLVRARR
jgi:hypothetical protein